MSDLAGADWLGVVSTLAALATVVFVLTVAAVFVEVALERRRKRRESATAPSGRVSVALCGAGIYRDLYRVGSCVLVVGHDGPCRPPCSPVPPIA